MWKLISAAGLALCLTANAHGARPAADTSATEIVYVRAQPAVALLAGPSNGAATVNRLTPGDALTVIGREAGFVNVQTTGGVQGWLRESDVTGASPPAQRVTALEQQVAELRMELASAQDSLQATQVRLRQAQQAASAARSSGANQNAALQAENAALQENLDAAEAEVSRLQARVAELEAAQQMARDAARLLAARQPADAALIARRFSPTELFVGITGALALLLLGIWLGTVRARRNLRRRYHGLEL